MSDRYIYKCLMQKINYNLRYFFFFLSQSTSMQKKITWLKKWRKLWQNEVWTNKKITSYLLYKDENVLSQHDLEEKKSVWRTFVDWNMILPLVHTEVFFKIMFVRFDEKDFSLFIHVSFEYIFWIKKKVCQSIVSTYW